MRFQRLLHRAAAMLTIVFLLDFCAHHQDDAVYSVVSHLGTSCLHVVGYILKCAVLSSSDITLPSSRRRREVNALIWVEGGMLER